jgi:xanthine dehydrogenase accessory factor
MSEIVEMLAAIESNASRGVGLALATVVDVRGSAYRRPGAMLLVPEVGDVVGTISGGCLEAAVVDEARGVLAAGLPRIVEFDLTSDDEPWGLGVGCNGAIEAFIQPLQPRELADVLRRVLRAGRSIAAVTVIASDVPGAVPGARAVIDRSTSGASPFSTRPGLKPLATAAADAAMAVLDGEPARVWTVDLESGRVRIFAHAVDPPQRLVVCGAGPDAEPLAATAHALGWSVVVVDDRPARLMRAHFPGAELVTAERPELTPKIVDADERTFVVIMAHHLARDEAYLRGFLDSAVPYIGMLGPRGRSERLLQQIEDEGMDVTAARERIHRPVGLDIGAEDPGEIALSVLAEIVAVRRGGRAGFLRDRDGAIHDSAGAGEPRQ